MWFAGTDHDVAIHCGRSGLVVLDVDRPEEVPEDWWRYLDAAPFQSTRTDTPGRGHYVFAMPPGRTIGNPALSWGEVRGLNGVIMAEPSHHKDGGHYKWVRPGPVPLSPFDLSIAISKERHPLRVNTIRWGAWAENRWDSTGFAAIPA